MHLFTTSPTNAGLRLHMRFKTTTRVIKCPYACLHAVTGLSQLLKAYLIVSNFENGTQFKTDDEVAARSMYA